MDLSKAIKARSSVRKFKSKKPDWRDILECIDLARYTPTAGHNYNLKFILVKDKEAIQQISDACQQDFITTAHYVVVVCSNPARLTNAYGEKGNVYSRQQAGASIQNFLLAIHEKGLSTCWVGYFVDEQIKELLKIPSQTHIEAIFPIGYEYDKKKTKKSPIDMDRVLYFGSYGQEKMKNWEE